MLWDIGLTEKGEDSQRGIDKVFDSIEIAKVLSMKIPVCLVLQLSKQGGSEDSSDALLCFPCNDCVHAYIYNIENSRHEFTDLGKFGDGEKDWDVKDENIKRYQYVVGLNPFLHNLAKNSYKVQFRFQIQRVGFTVLEITVEKDESKQKDLLSIDFYDCANEFHYSRGEGKQRIAILSRKETQNGFVWAPTFIVPTKQRNKNYQLPFIQGYMNQE